MGITSTKFKGEVTMWSFDKSFGYIKPDDLKKLPKKFQEAIQKDHEKRSQRAEKKGKDWKGESPSLFFRASDKADFQTRMTRGDKVQFKAYIDKKGTGACEVA